MSAQTTLTLSEDEAPLVAAEAAAAAGVLPEPLAQRAHDLAATAPTGAVPEELIAILEQVTTASLEGGRARRLYRAEGEKLLNAVLGRTPAGRASRQTIIDVNAALQALQGRPLSSVQVATRTPGHHTVRITADGVSIALGLSGGGIEVESVTL